MSKDVLVIYYSQSGQLKHIAQNFTNPFLQNNCNVEWLEIIPQNNFPFPWSGKQFFDAMPESVLGIPANIHSPQLKKHKYDLVVFAYQPWFLSPSIPATSALHHPAIKSILSNTPVITLIGSRNMWITAQEKIKKLLLACNANLVGNIVFSDRHNNFISAVTIQYWMFTGKKDKMWGIFPLPGVSQKDISSASEFGSAVLSALLTGNFTGLQQNLVEIKAVQPQTNLMFIEARASVLFKIWATAIRKKKNRALWLQFFKYYLLIALFLIAPVVLLIYNLLIRPLTQKQISIKKKYFSGVRYVN